MKCISNMLHIVYADISDKSTLENLSLDSDQKIKIDTIVNAAKPTLMGSDHGVDGAIHKKIDAILQGSNFNSKIRDELGIKEDINKILCPRGQAVMTDGYGLCRYVIHVVGAIYDIDKPRDSKNKMARLARHFDICSSSKIRTLESCYREIVRIIRQHPDIRNVAVPIIGSGEYGFPFKMAVKIAFSAIGNALFEWQQEDRESFDSSSEGLQNIVFFVWNQEERNLWIANDILKKYQTIFCSGQQVIWQNSFQTQIQYFLEMMKYDRNRGYFCIAKMTRLLLAGIRLFSVYSYMKDLFGGHYWQKRHTIIEITVAAKVAIAIFLGLVLAHGAGGGKASLSILPFVLLYYNMADTMTYLFVLILMADIQTPSANVIRSLLLLLLNYVEVSLEITSLYFWQYRHRGLSFLDALQPGITGNLPDGYGMVYINDHILFYGNMAVKFFFITVMFSYLMRHMRERKFKS